MLTFLMFTGGTKLKRLHVATIIIFLSLTFSQNNFAQSGVDEFKSGNYENALAYWTEGLKALPNSAELNYNVGKLFDRGLGTEVNLTKATQHYLNAAKLNHVPAMFSLGAIMAKNGNFKSAARWWQKASEGDLPEAQYNLARLYSDGVGVDKDLDKAKFWYKKAAQSALSKYQSLSAVLYQQKHQAN